MDQGDNRFYRTKEEDMKAEQAACPVRTAIAAIMAKVGAVSKDGENKYQSYKFAAIEDVAAKLQPLMAEHGLIIVPSEFSQTLQNNGTVLAITYDFHIQHVGGAVLTTIDHHGKTVPLVPQITGMASFVNSKGGADDKAANKCLTAAFKYFAIRLFQIPTITPDADSEPDRPPPAAPAGGVLAPPKLPAALEGPPRTIPLANPDDWGAVREWGALLAATLKATKTPAEAIEWWKLNDPTLNQIKPNFPAAYSRLQELKELSDARTGEKEAVVKKVVLGELYDVFAQCQTMKALLNVWATQVAGKFDDAALKAITAEFQKHEARVGAKAAA